MRRPSAPSTPTLSASRTCQSTRSTSIEPRSKARRRATVRLSRALTLPKSALRPEVVVLVVSRRRSDRWRRPARPSASTRMKLSRLRTCATSVAARSQHGAPPSKTKSIVRIERLRTLSPKGAARKTIPRGFCRQTRSRKIQPLPKMATAKARRVVSVAPLRKLKANRLKKATRLGATPKSPSQRRILIARQSTISGTTGRRKTLTSWPMSRSL
mmetsp:Transcript_15240/g.20703  ORF Transcript_15240/g.20703 Transcript_15240/m.20703 type:complete len:214 (+) Transcript_15240:953-1594(+)